MDLQPEVIVFLDVRRHLASRPPPPEQRPAPAGSHRAGGRARREPLSRYGAARLLASRRRAETQSHSAALPRGPAHPPSAACRRPGGGDKEEPARAPSRAGLCVWGGGGGN